MAQAAVDNHRVQVSHKSAHATASSQPTPAGSSSYFLFFVGLGLVAFGVGLIQPPSAVQHAEWIALKFSRLGVHGAPMIAAGMTIFCLGFVVRFQAKLGRALSSTNDTSNDHEFTRLAEEYAQLRGSLGNVQTELLANKHRQDSMLESIATFTEQPQAPDENSNAMFRLAASLDQLGARIEERLKHQASIYDGRLADITTAVVRAQQEITEAVDNVELTVSQPAQTIAHETNECPSEFTGDDFGFEEHEAPESAEEEFHVMVEFEEEVPEAPASAGAQDSPLGMLDSLDDFGGLVEPNAPLPNPPQTEQDNSWPPRVE